MTERNQDCASPNPDPARPGLWLSCRDKVILHLVETKDAAPSSSPQLEHFGLIGSNLSEIEQGLALHGVSYTMVVADERGAARVHLRDPDGNRIHIDIRREEDGTHVPQIS